GKEVKGKVVLASGAVSAAHREAVWKRGALGVVWYPGPEAFLDYPDQVRWLSIPAKSEEGKPGTFGFVLSRRQGVELARRLRAGAVTVRALVEAQIREPGWLVMVEGRIPGTEVSLPEVVFTAHLQEERFSANDDGSGCANTLEVARALARCIAAGRIPRPRRSMRFWWTTEIASENRYFSEHPEEVERVFCDVNQDMVGANQADTTMRVQNVTRLPWARAHVLEDVVEEIVGALVEGNTSYLNASRGSSSPFTRPVFARLGSRHRYNARLIPFHNSTDHQCFTAPPIGKPGFTFTNWPDDFIHSSDDDLQNIDPTQLQRNALAAAAIGFTMARLSAKDAPRLAAISFGNAARRFGREVRVAMGILTDPGELPIGERAKRARAQLRVAHDKEARAIASIEEATGGSDMDLAPFLVEMGHLHEHALDLLERTAIGLAGGAPPEESSSEAEAELAKMKPRLAGTVKDYFERRGKVRGEFHGLGGLMQWEVLSFANGSRTGLEVYECTAAESRSGGTWMYGEVKPEGVLAFLRACAEAKVVELAP
ncbi:MAG: M28 family peptidase, partial [Planctomycetota bacterium]